MSANTAGDRCPTEAQLRALLEGGLEEIVRPEVEEHVEVCGLCQTTLQHLCVDSGLMILARGGFGAPAEAWPSVSTNPAWGVPLPVSLRSPEGPAESARRIPEIPGFHQLEWLGRGGSGEVFRAWQPELARWIAIKTLSPDRSPTHADRVLREAKILGRLSHPHIVQIHETGHLEGQPYLVMEWMAGGSLQQRLQHGVLPIREAVRLGLQLAVALETVHALGIIHRDLKPANVLLQPSSTSGEAAGSPTLIAKLTDFSIAVDPTADDRLTLTGQVVGTPNYMAPEQTGLVPHLATVGPATDIYGLGAVLYAALTGQAPHSANTNLAILREVVEGEPRSPRTLRPEIPRDLETIVVKCLRHDPNRRYRTAGDLAYDLRRYLEGRPISARPYSVYEKLWYWGRRRPLWATGLAMGLLLGSLSVAGGVYHRQETSRLTSELKDTQQQVTQSTAQVRDEQVESRRAKWETLKQLTARSEMGLKSGLLAPEQRRGTLETVRRHYRHRVEDLDHRDPSTAVELAFGLEQLTELEEREGLLTQALDDLPLLDRVVAQFDPTLPLANHRVRRDLRRARILIQLHRLEEAADQIGALFDRHAGPSLDQNLLILLIGVTNLGRACSAAGKPGLILPHVDRALGVTQSHLAEHPDDLSIWRGRFELLAQKIQMREQQQDPLAGDLVEQEWLRFAREFCSQPTPPELPLRIARLQLMQRIAELSATRSTPFARENLVLWSRGIAAFRDGGAAPTPNSSLNSRDTPQGNHRAELVVQQVDCLTKHVRVGLPVEAPAPFQLPGWREALQAASLYLDERPDDQATRLRLAWSLVDHARCALSHDARRSLEAAQEAHQVLAPLAGHTGPDTEGRLLLADALYLSASALRKLGRLIECRLDLERAYLFSRGGNRDTIAADLVGVNVALGDQTAARKAAGWILSDGPQLKEARRLLGEMTTAQVPQ